MTNKKSTKRALLTSALSLLLCVSMLVGTTFAWFTDEVKSGTNIIAAGNLDVELTHTNKTVTDKDVKGETELFKDVKLWEPGAVAYEKLTVKNVGDLALKYNLAINVTGMNGVKDADGVVHTLAEVLKVAVVDADKLDSRENAIAAGEGKWQTLGSWAENGELYPETGKDTETYGVVIYWEPTDNDNLFNMNNGKKTTDGGKQLTIDLGVHLVATQLASEQDSYDETYDEKASVTATNAAELKAAIQNVEDGGIVFLEAGVYDLSSGPIVIENKTVTIVGMGEVTINKNYGGTHIFTIKNGADVTIKNVTMDGKGNTREGVYVRWNTQVTLENVVIKNTGGKDIMIDEASDAKTHGLETTSVVTLLNSQVEDVAICASPVTSVDATQNTYVYFNYDAASTVGSIEKQSINLKPENIYINGSATGTGTMIADGLWLTAANTYAITAPAGLVNLNTAIPKWTAEARRTVNLMTDLDMEGVAYTPLDKMFITFNGNNRTISNLTVNGDQHWGGASGLFAYLGAGTIQDLTLENVNSTGSQAGIFVGHSEAGNLINCTIAGTNTVTWNKATSDQVGDGIGAFVGVNIESSSTYTCTIAEGATVTLNMGKMSSEGKAIAKTNIYAGGLYQDSAPTVTVTNNGTVKASKAVSDAAELTAAVAAGVTDIYLLDGEYNLSGLNGKTVTLTGTEKAVIKVVDDGEKGLDAGCDGATITFNGVTFDTTANGGNNKGFTRMNGTYNNCAFVGSYTTSSGVHKFYNCTFDLRNNYVWTWGASEVLFDNCTFEDANGVGKAILVHEGADVTNVTVRDCTFTASTAAYTWDGLYVAAVSIDPNGASKQITVNFEGTNTVVTAEGATADANDNTGFAGLHQIKYANESSQITVKINGEVVNNIVATDYNPNL